MLYTSVALRLRRTCTHTQTKSPTKKIGPESRGAGRRSREKMKKSIVAIQRFFILMVRGATLIAHLAAPAGPTRAKSSTPWPLLSICSWACFVR